MNQLKQYDPQNYHINDTQTVFVQLDGSTLQLQRTKAKMPKRALSGAEISTPNFCSQRQYELKGARVFLQPAGLVKKRLWSKKYPICVALSSAVYNAAKTPAATPVTTTTPVATTTEKPSVCCGDNQEKNNSGIPPPNVTNNKGNCFFNFNI